MKSRGKEEKLCIFMIQGIFSTTGKEGNNCYIYEFDILLHVIISHI